MRVVIQKVKSASVTVDNQVVSQIGRGLLLLVGLSTTDTVEEVTKLANKVLKLRLFENEFDAAKGCWNGKPWAFNTKQAEAEILSVSQFTLYANLKKGAKPDFHRAMKGEHAIELYSEFMRQLAVELSEEKVKDGKFGAMMDVALVNDGPVTIVYDTNECLESK
ncbi:hypothetical protein BABINDRAFT_162842 [Babjeviella inositovora NRRL Y-12698]|uniref:D-aminoacyl-tRNA deacylase n=1 Tax=Babjeviella inositovora NRRL Y-12698 TaxID=984486 RepID=A0A1E3QKJ2_9ASCO|nr:uncharacterized protein BABINDRAFT_162842 [Babjeviella inositovora NRRL Y-12698]ODQ78170.1 hypothetical protein BABINDRAFT_162842 [Babjeviella inositovora NRRL Y-12698]